MAIVRAVQERTRSLRRNIRGGFSLVEQIILMEFRKSRYHGRGCWILEKHRKACFAGKLMPLPGLVRSVYESSLNCKMGIF